MCQQAVFFLGWHSQEGFTGSGALHAWRRLVESAVACRRLWSCFFCSGHVKRPEGLIAGETVCAKVAAGSTSAAVPLSLVQLFRLALGLFLTKAPLLSVQS
mmetsp:Transcript_24529/g.44990  ORF Transcript_24529/g.44990 Transcript_24529/m.44990 type:complete len:101 (+) Transcript_24529:402-704(+)